jgi:hypothetical protein
MLNPFKDVNWDPDLMSRRAFARSLVTGFPVVAAVLSLIMRAKTGVWKPFPLWIGGIGCGVGLVLWAIPQIARPFYMIWYALGCCIGIVMGNLLFSAFYYLVMAPFGIVMRVLGRDPLRKTFDKSAPTYWKDAEKVFDLKRYYRQF